LTIRTSRRGPGRLSRDCLFRAISSTTARNGLPAEEGNASRFPRRGSLRLQDVICREDKCQRRAWKRRIESRHSWRGRFQPTDLYAERQWQSRDAAEPVVSERLLVLQQTLQNEPRVRLEPPALVRRQSAATPSP
jgi:hypothetical protein